MTEQELLSWLKLQNSTLDRIIMTAGREFHNAALQNRSADQFGHDLSECQIESYNLIRNKDLCYDRPNTAFCYSLWYHARRVNTFLSYFAKTIFNTSDKQIEIFDLGAGTGAVQWAIGLVYHRMKEAGRPVPKIKVINVDTSPFMLYYSRDYLWKHFLNEYKHCSDFTNEIEYEINSWSNSNRLNVINPWITASYLFDISDTTDSNDYKKSVLKGFQEIIDRYNPSKLLLLTSLSKEHLVTEVSKEFNPSKYLVEKIKLQNLLLTGLLQSVNLFRGELYTNYRQFLTTNEAVSIRNPATWHDISFVGSIITKRQTEAFMPIQSIEGLKLHNTSIKIRREVELNNEQKKAARNINQPTVIIGPAGCGKSIVITERIKNIVEEANYDPNLRILLTTFNKELLGQLSKWLADILRPGSFRIVYDTNFNGFPDRPSKIFFTGSQVPNIRLLHFDMLPILLGNVPAWRLVDENKHKAVLVEIIKRIKQQNVITDEKFDHILNPDFLLEEYHRVIYGLQVGIKDAKDVYLEISRRGRGKKLDKSRRELVWQCLEPYANHIYHNHIPSFTLRRQIFLNKLLNKEINISYDHVIVDEFQDCTKADFEIFFNLLKDPNRLVISGDLAQAVHLGKSANIESLREAIRDGRVMNDISWNYLDGSYRLPFRICEAIKEISEHIHLSFKKNHAASILTPYKGAPPGARPIIIVGKDEKDISKKISEIIKQYRLYELAEKCILEKDKLLGGHTQIYADTVLRLKGMEKHCVIWSTRAPVEFKNEKFEFVYTILSRTSSILIIALFDNPDDPIANTQEIFKDAIGLLRKDRIILWDKETKDKFNTFCNGIANTDIDDEEE